MAEAVIVEAVRSPVGKRNGGPVRRPRRRPVRAGAQRLWSRRRASTPALVDDVIWGCVMQAGEQAMDIGRTAAVGRGLAGDGARRDRRPAVRIQPAVDPLRRGGRGRRTLRRRRRRRCGVDVAHADGCLARQRRQPVLARLQGPLRRATPNQGIGAEMIAEQWGFDRTTVDEFSLGSHEKAAAAQDSGAFDDQIVGDQGPGRQRQCSRTRASGAAPRSRRWLSSSPPSKKTA